jgi:hypothetical protein
VAAERARVVDLGLRVALDEAPERDELLDDVGLELGVAPERALAYSWPPTRTAKSMRGRPVTAISTTPWIR